MNCTSASALRVVIGNRSMLQYPTGGGHWMVRLNWMLGLRSLGHDPVLLVVTKRRRHLEHLDTFFAHLARFGLEDAALVALTPEDTPDDLEHAELHGPRAHAGLATLDEADLLWNDCLAFRGALLSRFKRRVLLDLDPGHLQVSALQHEMGIDEHDSFLTVGSNVGALGCDVPQLDVEWNTFLPPVHLPIFARAPHPPDGAAVTSVTHWTWSELHHGGRRLSISKRDAYLRHLDLPRKTSVPLELAVFLHPKDNTGDRELLRDHGWRLVEPWNVAGDPIAYRSYVRSSLAELSCPKPIFRELRTGWFSDRSACYLASGRPVVAEDTGFSHRLPTGAGLVTFKDTAEAASLLEDIAGNWRFHADAANSIAHDHLDARKVMPRMIEASYVDGRA